MPGPYPPYPSGPFSRKFAIGGAGGTNFLSVAQNSDGTFTGSTVKKISVWTNSNCLQGVRITYNDKNETSSPIYGRERGDPYDYTFAPGEAITKLKLWGNGVGTRTGRIAFTTTLKTETGFSSFDHGKNTKGQSVYEMPDIGSGILMGIFGRSGSEIDALGLIFLAKVDSIIITDVKYDLPDIISQGSISPVVLDQVTFPYKGTPQTWTFAGSQERSDTTTFSEEFGLTYGQSVTVKAGVPLIAEVEGTASWSISATFTLETSTTSQHRLEWGLSGNLNSDADSVRCQAICEYGFLASVPYTATVIVRMVSGESFSFKQSGKLNRTQYTDVIASATKINAGGLQAPSKISVWEGLED